MTEHGQAGLDPLRVDWSRLAHVSEMRVSEAAQLYVELGLHPILIAGTFNGTCTCVHGAQCRAPGKHPLEQGWQNGPLCPDKLRNALNDHRHSNLGLRMGLQPAGFYLVAIDVDGDLSLLDPLVRVHGPLPPTLTARTSRGRHLFFTSESTIKNRVNFAPKVDVRGEGGQVVAAPSLHVSGARYTWETVCAPAALP